MAIIPLGPWEPDSAGTDTEVLLIAKNVVPKKTGYGPFKSLSAVNTDALPAGCLGLITARVSAGGYITFAATQTKIYRYVTGVWVDYTRVSGGDYNVPSGDYWSYTQFGSYVIFVNQNDDPQYIDVDAGTSAFLPLAGSPPRARYVTVVGDFVVLACLTTDNLAIRNSAINDATGWTVGTNLCDEQTFGDGARITGVAGGEFGYVLQERAIRRMIFQPGSDIAFRFERVEKERGAAAGFSVVATINAVFFLSDDGFYAFGANGLVPIGAQRINDWFRANSDSSRFFSVLAFSDPFAPRIAWAFFNASGSTKLDRLLIYDWQLDRWAYAEVTAQFWAQLVTSGITLEDLDVYGSIDTGVPLPLDSRVWEGGAPVVGAVDSSGYLAFLDSSTPLDATLTTCPMRLMSGRRALVQSVEPVGEFNDATLAVRVGKRENTKDAVVYTASTTPSTRSGIARTRASGRVHEFELSLTQASGTLWEHVQGIDVMAQPSGTL